MLVDITMVDGTCHKVDFTDSEEIKDIRTWLNSAGSFISIANHTVINSRNIIVIKKADDNNNDNTTGECTVG